MKQYINNLSQLLHQKSEQELQQSIERLCKYLVIKSEESAIQTIMADSYALRYEAGTLIFKVQMTRYLLRLLTSMTPIFFAS